MKIKFKKCPKCNDNIKPLGFRSHYSKCKGIFKDIQHKVILKENYYHCPKCKDSISKYCFTRHLRTCKGIFKNRRVVILKEKSRHKRDFCLCSNHAQMTNVKILRP